MDQGNYTPITYTSATLADFGGIKTGHRRNYYNADFGCWQQWVLVFNGFGNTIADGAIVKLLTTAQTASRTGIAKVHGTTSQTSPVYAVNNLGKAFPDAVYGWMLQRGVGYGTGIAGEATTGTYVRACATAGAIELYSKATAAGTDVIVGIALTALTATTTNTIDWMLPARALAA